MVIASLRSNRSIAELRREHDISGEWFEEGVLLRLRRLAKACNRKYSRAIRCDLPRGFTQQGVSHMLHWKPAVLLAAGALIVAAPAASARPRVSLTVPGQVDAKQAFSVSYTARGLGRADRLRLQRQQGTARVWRTVRALDVKAGSATVSGLPLGTYNLRIAVISNSRRVRAERRRTVPVFGDVPLATLLASTVSGAYTTKTSVFPYVYRNYLPDSKPVFTAARNACRRVHLDLVPGSDSASVADDARGQATLLQEANDPASVDVSVNTIGQLDVPVTPGRAWSLRLSGGFDKGNLAATWYVNGYASCYRSGSALSR